MWVFLFHLCGLEVLSSNGAHLLPVAITEAWIEQGCYQTLQLLEVIHTGFSLCTEHA